MSSVSEFEFNPEKLNSIMPKLPPVFDIPPRGGPLVHDIEAALGGLKINQPVNKVYDPRILDKMKHSPVGNYTLPGLTSWLISSPDKEHGCVRMFEAEVNTKWYSTTPHSHRFNFDAYVIRGKVSVTRWDRGVSGIDADVFVRMVLPYKGAPGQYDQATELDTELTNYVANESAFYAPKTTEFSAGDSYSVLHNDFHTIHFQRGTRVLVFEGPQLRDFSEVLFPVVYKDKVLDTIVIPEWMFDKQPYPPEKKP